METLSIIAYFQPITKPEIEEIRGVSTHSGIFEILFNNDWIVSKGRKERYLVDHYYGTPRESF